MMAPMSSAQQQQQNQPNATTQEGENNQQQQQLYYAQLLAAQQQAISASSSSNCSNSPEKSGGGGDAAAEAAELKKKESERERKEREWSERNTNLIVNYVPQTMTQEEVRALFASIGEVESCKLIRDKATGQSLGYAFVNYERPEDANKALYSMNGLRIQNKTLKVSLARPSKDDIKGANLYVSGLPKCITQPELEAIFRPLGSIINSRILYDNVTGLSKGVGFVRFDCKTEAEEAIRKMNGTIPWEGADEPINVKFANSPSSNSTKSNAALQMAQSLLPLQQMLQQQQPTTCQPLSLPSLLSSLPTVSAQPQQQQQAAALAAAAGGGGGPIHAHIPQHRFRYSPLAGAPLISTSLPMFSSAVAGQNVPALSVVNQQLQQLQSQPAQPDYLSLLQQQLLQQQLNAATFAAGVNPLAAQQQNLVAQQYAAYMAALGAVSATGSMGLQQQNGTQINTGDQTKSPPGISGACWTLIISNLGPDTEEATLWKLFGPFGAVLAVRLSKGGKGGSSTGQVSMANYEEALAAMAGLNGQQLGGRTLQVSFGQSTGALPSLLR